MIYKEFPVSVDILWIGRLRVRQCPRRAHRQPGDKAVPTGAHAAPGTIATEHALPGELPCYGIYETGDGRYIALGALEKKFWHGW